MAIPSSRDESSETLQKRFRMLRNGLRCALKRSRCLETTQNRRFSLFFAADRRFLLRVRFLSLIGSEACLITRLLTARKGRRQQPSALSFWVLGGWGASEPPAFNGKSLFKTPQGNGRFYHRSREQEDFRNGSSGYPTGTRRGRRPDTNDDGRFQMSRMDPRR